MTTRRAMIFGLPALVLAGCGQTSTGAGPEAANYTIAGVDVAVAPDAVFSFVSLDGLTDAQQGEMMKAELRRVVYARVGGHVGRPKQARLELILRLVDVASGAGRVLGASDSTIVADVRLTDAVDKHVVAFRANLRADEQGMKASGSIGMIPVGSIVSLAVNASNADKTYTLVAEAFAKQVEVWLAA